MDPGLAAVARSLRKLPELAKRFEAGEVNAHHVAVTGRHHANARITDTVEREQSQRTTQENGRLLCPFHNHLRQRRAPRSAA